MLLQTLLLVLCYCCCFGASADVVAVAAELVTAAGVVDAVIAAVDFVIAVVFDSAAVRAIMG